MATSPKDHATRGGGRRRRNGEAAFSASQSSVDSLRSSFPAPPSVCSSVFNGLEASMTRQQQQWRKHHWGMHYWVDKQRRGWNAVWAGRILVVIVLVAVASLMGFLAFTILTRHEQHLAETQFQSISQRALASTKIILQSKRDAGVSMAQMAAELYPDAAQWPFVEFLGFERLAKSLLGIARSSNMALVPYVLPDQQGAFEAFAIQVYDKLGFNSTSGRQGVWQWDQITDAPAMFHDAKDHDHDHDDHDHDHDHDEASFPSSYNIITPVFQTERGGQSSAFLFDMHSLSTSGQQIDSVISCSETRKLLQEVALQDIGNYLPPEKVMDCGVTSDLYPLVYFQGRWGASSTWPIYPINDPLTLVGHITTVFLLDELLENNFATEISGVDAIFETQDQAVSYTIQNGVGVLVGEGKHFDPEYERHNQSLTLLEQSVDADAPLTIKLTLVPNKDFYKVYETSNPGLVTVGAVLTILMASLVFFLYDSLVRREFNAKQELLEARRQFMRFVSHEVRTPLNAVSMGLDLMQSELAQALGYESPTSLRASQALQTSQRNINITGLTNKNSSSRGFGDRHKEIKTLADLRREYNNNPQEYSNETCSTSESYFDAEGYQKSEIQELGSSNQPPLPLQVPCQVACLSSQQALEWFELTQEIQGNTQGAVDILNDILNYDKIEQRTLQLSLELISVWELLETATLEFKLPASSKEVQLDISFGCCVEDELDPSSEEMHMQDDKKSASEPLKFARAKNLPPHVKALRVIGDSVRLTQVLRNFCSNALKFTPPNGSVQVHALYVPPKAVCTSQPVDALSLDYSSRSNHHLPNDKGEEIILANDELVAALPQGCIKVRVTDTGAGMTPDQLSKLFQDGVQFNVNELQAGQGSGLGLYIAKGIVEQHNGIMSATSEGLGQGTTFEMELPLWSIIHRGDTHKRMYSNHGNLVLPSKTDDIESGMLSLSKESDLELDFAEEASPAPPIEEPKKEVAPPSCLQVLIVDDVMSNRKLLKRLLERNGHQCDEAENGQVAVQMVERAASREMPYDSILLDYEMPVMDGPTAAKEIRRLGFDDVFMVGITGNVLPEDIRVFKSCGANDVLAKPVKIPDLYAAWVEHGVCSHRPIGTGTPGGIRSG